MRQRHPISLCTCLSEYQIGIHNCNVKHVKENLHQVRKKQSNNIIDVITKFLKQSIYLRLLTVLTRT